VAPKLRKSRSVPIIGESIPDFGHERGAWRKAITQWEQGTCEMPHDLALKDWQEAWYTKGMASVTGSKRSQRNSIADEYNRCVLSTFHCRSAKYSHSRSQGCEILGCLSVRRHRALDPPVTCNPKESSRKTEEQQERVPERTRQLPRCLKMAEKDFESFSNNWILRMP
jgi:hypothetical protein